MKIRRDPLDILFSEYMRKKAKGACEKCGREVGYSKLQVSHLFGRRHKAVRWSERNVCVVCFSCHLQQHESPVEHVNWFIEQRGQQEYDFLLAEVRVPVRFLDKKAIELYLRERLADLTKTP